MTYQTIGLNLCQLLPARFTHLAIGGLLQGLGNGSLPPGLMCFCLRRLATREASWVGEDVSLDDAGGREGWDEQARRPVTPALTWRSHHGHPRRSTVFVAPATSPMPVPSRWHGGSCISGPPPPTPRSPRPGAGSGGGTPPRASPDALARPCPSRSGPSLGTPRPPGTWARGVGNAGR